MKYLFLVLTVIVLSGCSKKCMNNEYDCTPAESFMNNVIKGAANTAEFINKHTQNMEYLKN